MVSREYMGCRTLFGVARIARRAQRCSVPTAAPAHAHPCPHQHMAADELPDAGYVTLCQADGAAFLCHRVTRERVALPRVASPLRWNLGFDDNGWAFVEAGSDRRWASSLFEARAVRAGGAIGVLSGEGALHLSDYMNEHRMKLLPIHVGPASIVLKVWVFVRQQPGGCKWWWGLSSMWQALQLSTVRPGEWVANWWRHWVKRFAKFEVGSPHFRPSERMQKAPKFGIPPELDINERVLPEASVSTPLLLALLARLSARSRTGREKKQEELEQWALFLDALLKQCLPPDFVVLFWLDVDVPMPPDDPPVGHHRIRLEIRGGKVLPPSGTIEGYQCPFPAAFARIFAEEGLSLAALLRALDSDGGVRMFGIFWQIATGIAMAIETRLTADEHPERTAVAVMRPQAASKRQKMHLSRMAKACFATRCRSAMPCVGPSSFWEQLRVRVC